MLTAVLFMRIRNTYTGARYLIYVYKVPHNEQPIFHTHMHPQASDIWDDNLTSALTISLGLLEPGTHFLRVSIYDSWGDREGRQRGERVPVTETDHAASVRIGGRVYFGE